MPRRYNVGIIALSIVAFIPVLALAQEGDNCSAVYQTATRNLNINENSYSSLNTVFDAYCSASGEKKSKNKTIGVDAIISQIPIKFSGTSGSAEERFNNFCSTYKDVRFTTSASSSYSNQVVVDALRAFNQCEEILRRNINIIYASPNDLSSVFSFQFGTNTSYELQGVTTDKGLSCSVVDEDKKSIPANKDSYLTFKRNFTVSCEREGSPKASGGTYYPRTGVVFGSNHGPYSMMFPAQEIEDVEFATALEQRMKAIENHVSAIKESTDQSIKTLQFEDTKNAQIVTNLKSNMSVKTLPVMYGQSNPVPSTFFHIPCNQDLNAWVQSQCPKQKTHLQHIWTTAGGQCGYGYFVATCTSIE